MIQQLRVTLPNEPGSLGGMVAALAEANVDMKALAVSDRGPGDHGEASLIVSDVKAATRALEQSGHAVEVSPALAVEMDDRVGGLSPVLATLAAAGINVKQLYAFVSRVEGKSLAVLSLDETDKARAELERKGFHLLEARSLEGGSDADEPYLGDHLGVDFIW